MLNAVCYNTDAFVGLLCLSALAAAVSTLVTARGRDDDASNISKHLLRRVNISLCDRREYQITCVRAGRVALETMRVMMSRRHHVVTARSSIQLWPVFQSSSGRTEQTQMHADLQTNTHGILLSCANIIQRRYHLKLVLLGLEYRYKENHTLDVSAIQKAL